MSKKRPHVGVTTQSPTARKLPQAVKLPQKRGTRKDAPIFVQSVKSGLALNIFLHSRRYGRLQAFLPRLLLDAEGGIA